jgi:hypothetical protein
VLQIIDPFEISCLRASFSWLEKPKNHMGQDLNWILCSVWKKWIGGTPLEHPSYSPDLTPCDFVAFQTTKSDIRFDGAQRLEISKWWMVCSMFSRSRWSVVRSASLAKGGTLKKRPSPHLH